MAEAERLVISVDPRMKDIIKRYKMKTGKSQSKIVKELLENYFDQTGGDIGGFDSERARLYHELLSSGEHIILDMDHWVLFLRMLETLKDPEEFWEVHRQIGRSHAEQLVGKAENFKDVLERLEVCNLFKLRKAGEGEFTLILGTVPSKRFLKVLLEEIAKGLGFDIRIKEDFSKLRVEV
jgi:hypothetical protein